MDDIVNIAMGLGKTILIGQEATDLVLREKPEPPPSSELIWI